MSKQPGGEFLRAAAVPYLLALLLGLMTLVTAASFHAAQAGQAVATGARVGGDNARTRFVADLTGTVSYTVYVLPDPYRVIIDLPDVRFNLQPGVGKEARGLIAEYRYGEIEPGRARIVMDTTGPVLIEKSFLVEPQAGQPARIVVDLVGISEEAFLKTFKAEEQANHAAVAAAEQPAAAQPDRTSAEPVDAPAATAELPPEKAAPPARRDGKRIVVIDPGHGGIDPGAVGINRTREKDVVLAFGRTLRDILQKTGRYKVVMTRDTDTFVTLKQRVRIARDNEADLFIAIHADTVRGQNARGATIYTLSEKASDKEAEALAHKENRADIIGGIDLGAETEEVTDILIDLAQRESKNHSVFFARKAVKEMKPVTAFTGKPMRSAGFVVLKAPDVPSVLIELGYLSSKRDESQLSSDSWRDKVAAAMARAIDGYFSTEVAVRAE